MNAGTAARAGRRRSHSSGWRRSRSRAAIEHSSHVAHVWQSWRTSRFSESILKHVFRLLTILACCAGAAACGSKSPEPPVVTPPGGSETITGAERIGWDQRAGDAVELAGISYVIYVDGTRMPLADVACASAASAAGYACSARLPAMTAGAHTLQLASTVDDGGLQESARSASLNVTVAAQTAGELRPPSDVGADRTASRQARSSPTTGHGFVSVGCRRTARAGRPRVHPDGAS